MTAVSTAGAGTTRIGYVFADSITMVSRNLLHMVRYPGLTVFTVALPVVFLLLTVFVFGGTLGAGLPNVSGDGRSAYLAYVVPGFILVTIGGGGAGTAITVATDMTEGIVARFRSMAISRAAVLAGHVLGNVLQGLIAVLVLLVAAIAIGFRPSASPLDWLALLGVVTLILLAITWLCVGMGMSSKTVENASNLPLPLVFLPFLGSGFVPTDSMPAVVRAFAEVQPFTPFIETVRSLLLGTPMGANLWLTVGWCVLIGAGGYAWSMRLYNRKSVR